MNYRDVFQLAEEKGYTNNISFASSVITEDEFCLVYMTLIQKWLIHEHKTFVEIVIMQPYKYAFEVYDVGTTTVKYGYKTYSDDYESALLEGIKAALQLI